MTRERYANLFETTLTADVTAGATTWPVASVTGLPAPNTRLVCGSEIVLVTAVSTLDLTVARGQEGTTAASHSSGDRVVHVLTAAGLAASAGPMTTAGDMVRALADGEPTRIPIGSSGQFMRVSGGVPTWGDVPGALVVVLDGGGAVLSTGIKTDLYLPFAGTITEWTILADQSGSIVIDIWKDSYGNYPPTVADTITAAAKPTLSAATKAQSSALTGWTTGFSSGDTLRFNVDSATTVTRVVLVLKFTRS